MSIKSLYGKQEEVQSSCYGGHRIKGRRKPAARKRKNLRLQGDDIERRHNEHHENLREDVDSDGFPGIICGELTRVLPYVPACNDLSA